jgi:type VI secretion system protein ImpF
VSSGSSDRSTIRLSLLDRLMDNDPTNPNEVPPNNNEKLRMVQAGVRRDLEDLLNTRYRCVSWPPLLDQIDNSLVNYGIPDFTAASMDAAEESDHMLKAIRRAIDFFEPRLTELNVVAIENDDQYDRTFRFRIEATMVVEDGGHRVQFNSSMESTTGQFDIE